MRLKAIICQVFTREMEDIIARSKHTIDLEVIPMGLHSRGAQMHTYLQERIDSVDEAGYDAILLGYALCGRGTEGLQAGKTPLVLPRAHDCIGVLMGGHRTFNAYFQQHPGTYFRTPGWVEFQTGTELEPPFAAERPRLGERSTLQELVSVYGEEDGKFLFDQFNAFRKHYSGLTYISLPVASDEASRSRARAEAAKEGWKFEEVKGTLSTLEHLVNGDWSGGDVLLVPPGAMIRAKMGDAILDAVTDAITEAE
jgi:hypothetical protein